MNAIILTKRAGSLGLPIAKNAFEGTLENPVPDLPYLVYTIPHTESRGADTINNLIAEDWNLELYTVADDEAAAALMEYIENEVLFDVDYEKFIAPIEDEECFQTAYEVKGLLRKVKGVKKTWTKKALF